MNILIELSFLELPQKILLLIEKDSKEQNDEIQSIIKSKRCRRWENKDC